MGEKDWTEGGLGKLVRHGETDGEDGGLWEAAMDLVRLGGRRE